MLPRFYRTELDLECAKVVDCESIVVILFEELSEKSSSSSNVVSKLMRAGTATVVVEVVLVTSSLSGAKVGKDMLTFLASPAVLIRLATSSTSLSFVSLVSSSLPKSSKSSSSGDFVVVAPPPPVALRNRIGPIVRIKNDVII